MLSVVEVFKKSDTGRQRRANEDNLFVAEPLFVVADGMGGARAGEVASQTAVEAFEAGLPESGSAEERLATVIRSANERIHGMAQGDEQLAGMGTTVTAALVGSNVVSIAHVGDSRAYVWRDGKLLPLTRDHSLVAELVARGKLTEAQAAEHPQRSIITRALGPEANVEVDTKSHGVRDGDLFLLCSDGLTSMIDDATVAAVLREATSIEDAGDRLIAAANEAGGRDNITVVLFRVHDDGTGPSADQPTGVGEIEAADVEAAASEGQTTKMTATPQPTVRTPAEATAQTPAGAVDAEAETPKRTAPRAPRAPATPARRRRFAGVRTMVSVLIGVLLVSLLAVAAVLFARQNFFIGKTGQGNVAIYRGIDLSPLGIKLYSTYCTSPLKATQVSPSRTDRSSRSKGDALDLVTRLYVARERKAADARARAAKPVKPAKPTKPTGGSSSSGGSSGSGGSSTSGKVAPSSGGSSSGGSSSGGTSTSGTPTGGTSTGGTSGSRGGSSGGSSGGSAGGTATSPAPPQPAPPLSQLKRQACPTG